MIDEKDDSSSKESILISSIFMNSYSLQKDELQKNLEDEIEKINEENKISNFEIEEIYIKPKRTDIFNVKLELLWKEE